MIGFNSCVYAAFCKRTGAILYIGKTRQELSVRIKQHFYDHSSFYHNHKEDARKGGEPFFIQIKKCTERLALYLEKKTIKSLHMSCVGLLNARQRGFYRDELNQKWEEFHSTDLLGIKGGTFTEKEITKLSKLAFDIKNKKPDISHIPIVRKKRLETARVVDKKINKKWNKLKTANKVSLKNISVAIDFPYATVLRAINHGIATQTTIDKLNKYFGL